MKIINTPTEYQEILLQEILKDISKNQRELNRSTNTIYREILDNKLTPQYAKLGKIIYSLKLEK